MLIDKEYPATHSMATAWYVVDEEGKVGITQFDRDGPIPIDLAPTDYFAETLLWGEGLYAGEHGGGIAFTPEQMSQILGTPIPCEKFLDGGEYVGKVAAEHRERFWKLAAQTHLEVDVLSEEQGIYLLWQYIEEENMKYLQSILDEGLISALYPSPEYGLTCFIDENGKAETSMYPGVESPYYLYCQSEWGGAHQRLYVPSSPLRLEQISPEHREKLLRIPGKFDELERFDLTRWFKCR